MLLKDFFVNVLNAACGRTRMIGVAFSETFSYTGDDEMKDLIKLIDVICEAYDNSSFIPVNGETHCNEAIAMVADAMGCKDLDMKMADEIVEFLAGSADWQEVQMNQVQDMANQGSLCIAGLDSTALSQAHGHVVVIRPGKPVYSGKWGPTPRCLNVGQEMFLARAKKGPLTNMSCGVNEGFQPMPKFWVWRPSL
jgi:hypothetical protein